MVVFLLPLSFCFLQSSVNPGQEVVELMIPAPKVGLVIGKTMYEYSRALESTHQLFMLIIK